MLCRFLAEHIRVIREQLEIGTDFVPVGGDHEVIDLLLFGLFIPLGLGIVAGDGFVAQEQAFLRRLKDEIFGQIRLDAALCRVDLKPCENSEGFGAFAALLPVCVGAVLVVGDDAEAQRRVADLPHAGGKGAFHRLRPRFPVAGVGNQRIGGGDLQYGLFLAGISALHAVVDQRIGDSLDHIAVVVRAAEPFGDQRTRIDHKDVVKVREIFLPYRSDLGERRDERFLVAGDMRTAQEGVIRLLRIGG